MLLGTDSAIKQRCVVRPSRFATGLAIMVTLLGGCGGGVSDTTAAHIGGAFADSAGMNEEGEMVDEEAQVCLGRSIVDDLGEESGLEMVKAKKGLDKMSSREADAVTEAMNECISGADVAGPLTKAVLGDLAVDLPDAERDDLQRCFEKQFDGRYGTIMRTSAEADEGSGKGFLPVIEACDTKKHPIVSLQMARGFVSNLIGADTDLDTKGLERCLAQEFRGKALRASDTEMKALVPEAVRACDDDSAEITRSALQTTLRKQGMASRTVDCIVDRVASSASLADVVGPDPGLIAAIKSATPGCV